MNQTKFDGLHKMPPYRRLEPSSRQRFPSTRLGSRLRMFRSMGNSWDQDTFWGCKIENHPTRLEIIVYQYIAFKSVLAVLTRQFQSQRALRTPLWIQYSSKIRQTRHRMRNWLQTRLQY